MADDDQIEKLTFTLRSRKGKLKFEGIKREGQETEGDSSLDQDRSSENFESSFGAEPVTLEPSEAARMLSRLAERWTLTAIGFFNIVPSLSARNWGFTNHQALTKVRKTLEQMNSEYTEEIIGDDESLIHYHMTLSEFHFVMSLLGKNGSAILAARSMSNAALSALVSEYEGFISSLLKILSRIVPDAFIGKDETIPLASLSRYRNFADLWEDLVDEKITELSHKSHLEILDWMHKRFEVNLTSDKKLMSEFAEIVQRRHLLAHAGSVANNRYIQKCQEAAVPEDKMLKLGEEVRVNRDYLRSATRRVYTVGYFALHLLWQRLLPSHFDRSISQTIESSHDLLTNDLTKTAAKVCEFGLFKGDKLKAQQRMYLVINLAQAKLFDPDLSSEQAARAVEATLSKFDFSVTSPEIDLALACLRRDFTQLDAVAAKAALAGLTQEEAVTWSIFREVRSRPEFLKNFSKSA